MRTVEVQEHGASFPGRYVARMLLDCTPTSLDCTHLHHSPEQATRCVRKVERAIAAFVDDPTFVEIDLGTTPDGCPLIEWVRVTGERTRTSRRFSLLEA